MLVDVAAVRVLDRVQLCEMDHQVGIELAHSFSRALGGSLCWRLRAMHLAGKATGAASGCCKVIGT
jgi:hypothetical protein